MSENRTREKFDIGLLLSHPVFPVTLGVSILTGGLGMEEALRYYRNHYLTGDQKANIPYLGQYLEELLTCDNPQKRAKELHLPKSGHTLQIAHEYFKKIKPKGAPDTNLLEYHHAALPYLHFMLKVRLVDGTIDNANQRFFGQMEKNALSIVLALEKTYRANLIQEGYKVNLSDHKGGHSHGITGKKLTVNHSQKQHWPGTSLNRELGTVILTRVPQMENVSSVDATLTDFSHQENPTSDELAALTFGALNLAVSNGADYVYFFPDIPEPLRLLIPSLAYNGMNPDGSLFLNLVSLLPKDREPSLLKL